MPRGIYVLASLADGELLAPLNVTSLDRARFDAEFRIVSIDPEHCFDACEDRIDKQAHRCNACQAFFVMMPLRGSVTVVHYGRKAILERGDCV